MKEIRKDCFWYRPWKDMSATFHQCHLKDTAEECSGNGQEGIYFAMLFEGIIDISWSHWEIDLKMIPKL